MPRSVTTVEGIIKTVSGKNPSSLHKPYLETFLLSQLLDEHVIRAILTEFFNSIGIEFSENIMVRRWRDKGQSCRICPADASLRFPNPTYFPPAGARLTISRPYF
jgi:hypothetical protein